MPIYDTFSKRQKKLRGDAPDVYVYDDVPVQLRIQIVMIMQEALGGREQLRGEYGNLTKIAHVYDEIVRILKKEMAVFKLPGSTRADYDDHVTELTNFLLNPPGAEHFLDAVELICRCIDEFASQYDYRGDRKAEETATAAIAEINHRFKEHAFGYEYDGEILRIDSQLVHAEVVKPALHLLRVKNFNGAEDEFLKAYEYYRKADHKSALVEALKALESTMKSICDTRKWTYEKTDTASKLLRVCFDKGLVPPFWESHFSALRTTLEAGVPTARNKLGGHGQGTAVAEVPDHIVSYALHSTAAAIGFLIKAEQALS